MILMPDGPRPISEYWLNRGLVLLYMGDGLFWAKGQGWVVASGRNGGPKKVPSKFGVALGIGATLGTGTTDRITGPVIDACLTHRSIIVFTFALSAGGASGGRVLQGAGESGFAENNESIYHATTAGSAMRYNARVDTGGVGGQWEWPTATYNSWQCFGLSHDRVAKTTPSLYRNGEPAAPIVVANVVGTYIARTYTSEIGNRSTDSARSWDGAIGPIFVFDHPSSALTAKEHAKISFNPGTIFANQRRIRFAPAAVGGAGNVNLFHGKLSKPLQGKL